MKLKLHHPMLLLHRWTGLTLGLLFLFLAVTGLGLVFREQLAPSVDAELHGETKCAVPLPLDRLIAAARTAHPGAKIDVVRMRGSEQSLIVRMSDRHDLYVSPCSAEVMADRERWAGVFGTLEELHRFRFLESADVGNFITGSAAFAMLLLMGIGGLIVLWPGSTHQLRAVTRPRLYLRGRALDLNLHRSAGFYVAAVIVVVAATSLPLAFKWVRTAINVTVGSTTAKVAKPQSVVVEGAKPLSAGALWQHVQTLLGGPAEAAQEVSIQLPRKKTDTVEIYVVEAGAAHPNARSYYYLDAYSGQVLRAEPYASSPLGNRIYRFAASLHSGGVGGLPIQLLFFAGMAGVPLLAFTGLRSFVRRRRAAATTKLPLRLRVAAVREEASEVKSFELVARDGTELPPFSAGAHIDVLTDGGLMRQYSLCNDSAERNRYVIAVKRASDSRGGSAWLHEDVAAGDELSVGLPRNHFALRSQARHHVLMAAGIGITPLLAMARELRRRGDYFVLHYFARSPQQMAFHEELSSPVFQGKVHFHYAVERDRLGETLRNLLWHRPQGAHLYLCGPRGFMELVEASAAATWPPEAVHVEHFGADPNAFAGERRAFTIHLRRSDCSLQVPADKSVAEVLRCHGMQTFTSCEQGVCGSCLAGVLDGTPDHRDAFLSPAERKAGNKMMVCVSRAKTESLVLDL